MAKTKVLTTSTLQNSASKTNKCQLCNDRGLVIKNNTAMPCRCQDDKRRQRLIGASKITPAFQAKTLDNFTTKNRPESVIKMLMSARHYANNFGNHGENNWLVLLGEPGSGKTHLSLAVANQLLSQGVPVLYFPHVEGFAELKNSFNRHQGEERLEDKLRELRQVDVLVWDDLFKDRKKPSEWALGIVFDVLNYRYFNLLPTIISSERLPADLLNIDMGLGSRIIERGKGHLVFVSGMENNYRITGT